jgi:hypothetical protein
MKKLYLRGFFITQLIFLPLFIMNIFADPPDPPGPGGPPIGNGVPVGGNTGAPIGDGIAILLTLSIAYGTYKIYKIWKKRGTLNTKNDTI